MRNQTVATAEHYYEEGFSIFPLKPSSKEPAYGSWLKYQTERASLEQIDNWWGANEDLNIAIVCGTVSGIVVIDIDNKEALPAGLFFPPTATVKTSRGHHYYYQLKEGQKVKSMKFDWGEIRSDGNYVAAPFSVHPSGEIYKWIDCDWATRGGMDYFPYELLQKLNIKDSGPNSKLYETAFKGQVGEGSRNSTMASVIGKLLRDFPNQEEWPTTVWELVKGVNQKRCNPPLELGELERTFESICKAQMRAPKERVEKKEFEIVTGSEIIKLETSANPFLVSGMIYEKAINAITADSGKGKSILALIVAKSISLGEKLFDRLEAKKTKVLVIDQEMDADLIVARYKEIIGTEKPEVDYMYEQAWTINEEADFDWLKKTIVDRGYGCVIFDTLTNIHTFDENKAEDMREVNKLFLELIKETGVTIIYLHHHRKPQRGEKTNQSSSRGSTEIVAKMASHILLDSKKTKDSDGRTVTSLTIKQSKSRRPEIVENMVVDVINDPISKTTTWEFRGKVKDDISAVQRACDEMLALLKEHGEMTMDDLFQESSVGKSSVRTAAKILVKNNLIDFSTGKDGLKTNAKVYFLRGKDDY